jgi:peptidoglycan/LPS O-acetylase OafA/YrhL
MASGPLFLARAVYRRRRLRDAARLLPVLGLLLLLLPGLGRETGSGARDAVYLFAIWAALILAAAVLAPRLSQNEGEEAEPQPEEER